jgi:hypothetical protein
MQDSSLVYRLKKSLYGLKQAPRAWYAKMDSYLLSQNFVRCKSDLNVYMLKMNDSLLLLVLYVDELLISGCSTLAIFAVKRILHDKFLMTDVGPLHFFLGLKISQGASGIKLSQAKYARDLLERFHMTDCKSAPTPFLLRVKVEDGGKTPLVDNTLYRQLVGSLFYLTHSIPDLSYAVGAVSRFMQESHELHWKVAKRILRYVEGTITFGIHYAADSTLDLIGFTNSNWVADSTDRKSTSGYSLGLGSEPICWSSKKQPTIALSSIEAEYRGVVNNRLLPSCALHQFSHRIFPRTVRAQRVSWETLHPPPLKVVVGPRQHPLISMASLPHLRISSPLNNCCFLNYCHQDKLSLGSSAKCAQVLDALHL